MQPASRSVLCPGLFSCVMAGLVPFQVCSAREDCTCGNNECSLQSRGAPAFIGICVSPSRNIGPLTAALSLKEPEDSCYSRNVHSHQVWKWNSSSCSYSWNGCEGWIGLSNRLRVLCCFWSLVREYNKGRGGCWKHFKIIYSYLRNMFIQRRGEGSDSECGIRPILYYCLLLLGAFCRLLQKFWMLLLLANTCARR